MPGRLVSNVLNKGVPLMAFEGLFNTALKGVMKVGKASLALGMHSLQAGRTTGVTSTLGGVAKGVASQLPKNLWANVQVADRVAGETFDILARRVGTGTGPWNRAKDVMHVGAVNLLPVGAVVAGGGFGARAAAEDIMLGGVNIGGLSDSIHMGATPGLERTRNPFLNNPGSARIPAALDQAYRNGRTLDEMLNGSGGDLALALANRGGF